MRESAVWHYIVFCFVLFLVWFCVKATCSDMWGGKETKKCASVEGEKLRRETDPVTSFQNLDDARAFVSGCLRKIRDISNLFT